VGVAYETRAAGAESPPLPYPSPSRGGGSQARLQRFSDHRRDTVRLAEAEGWEVLDWRDRR
jgi:hypothetical protein